MSNQIFLEKEIKLDVFIGRLELSADFKDMNLLMRYYSIYEKLLKPSIEKAL